MEEIRRLDGRAEMAEALSLCRRVFDEFVAPGYSEAGRLNFYHVTELDENLNGHNTGLYTFYGAYRGDTLLGVGASGEEGGHVLLLFVDKAYHHKGIARKLVDRIIQDAPGNVVTVNASPYAKAAYERMGFAAADGPRTECGMVFVPMEYHKN